MTQTRFVALVCSTARHRLDRARCNSARCSLGRAVASGARSDLQSCAVRRGMRAQPAAATLCNSRASRRFDGGDARAGRGREFGRGLASGGARSCRAPGALADERAPGSSEGQRRARPATSTAHRHWTAASRRVPECEPAARRGQEPTVFACRPRGGLGTLRTGGTLATAGGREGGRSIVGWRPVSKRAGAVWPMREPSRLTVKPQRRADHPESRLR